MKISEIIEKVDKSDQFKSEINIAEFSDAASFGISNIPDVKQNRLESYYIGSWYCDDYYVGWLVYFFDDEPIAMSSLTQEYNAFEWVSKKAFNDVKKYILQFLQFNEDDDIPLLNMNAYIDESYKLEYCSQLLPYHYKIAKLNGENVEIIEVEQSEKDMFDSCVLVKIKLQNDSEKWITLNKLDFPFNLK